MPDADRLDRILAEAGERWRASQPPAPALPAVWRPPARRSRFRVASLLVAAGLVTLLAAAAVNMGGAPVPSPVAVGPSPPPTVPGSCPATLRSDEPGPLASQTASLSLPGSLVPYGQPALWATIPRSGSLASGPSRSGGRFVRTFWYSDRWSIAEEPSPSISVSAGRLGGGDSVTGSAAVSAHSRELGDSMIVSLDLPSGGCWQITGTYRDQSLSYVVWVERDTSTLIVSDATDLPGDVDGVPVVKAADAPARLAATQPGESILVGGWLEPVAFMSCPMMRTFPDVWNVCSAIRLATSPRGDAFVGVYHPASNPTLPTIPEGQVEPVVLRVHSHDPGCPAANDCASLAVLDAVVWLGQVGPASAPTSTAPPSGMSETDARAAALRSVHDSFVVETAVAGPYGLVGPRGSRAVAGDRWVWAVTLVWTSYTALCIPGPCPTVKDLVVLDYVTGDVLLEETVFNGNDPVKARNVIGKYLDSIGGRDWDAAWGDLSAYSHQRYGSEAAFIETMTRGPSPSSSVQIGDPVALLASDLVDSGFVEPGLVADVEATAVGTRAFVISTVDPSVDGASAGSRTYVVAALDDTEWRIWIVH